MCGASMIEIKIEPLLGEQCVKIVYVYHPTFVIRAHMPSLDLTVGGTITVTGLIM